MTNAADIDVPLIDAEREFVNATVALIEERAAIDFERVPKRWWVYRPKLECSIRS
jgi:hypothetical protein